MKHVRHLFVALLFLLVGSTLELAAQQAPRTESASLMERASQSRAKGRDGAPVLVYEIADFQCPFCARFAREVFPKLEAEYVRTGKVQWVFVNMPLPNHARAWIASEAAICAGAAGDKFWPVHDRLFANPNEWINAPDPSPVLAGYAREAGVPMKVWEACVTGDQVAPILLQDMLFAGSTGASGTPAFVIDKQQLVVGLKTYEEWRDILEKALQAKKDD